MVSIDLRLGDCLQVLPTLPDNSVDAVVTDPPYGIGKTYGEEREAARTPEKYWVWLSPIHDELMRILRPGGFWAYYQAGPYMRYLWEWFGENMRLYVAAKNFVPMKKTAINHGFDPVAIGYKHGALPLRPDNPERSLDFYVANTAGIISDTERIEKDHPTPKPLDGVIQIIRNFTLPGGVVIDPFMGSGTTGLACKREGRSFIGIEREPEYFEIAKRRIEDAQRRKAESPVLPLEVEA